MTMVHTRHIRAANLCMGGARRWFETHGLSWQEFLDNGMTADELDATGDGFAHMVTAKAREEEVGGQGE